MKRVIVTIVGTVAGLAMLLGFKTQPLGTTVASGIVPNGGSGATATGQSNNGGSSSGTAGNGGSSGGSTATTSAKQTVTGQAANTPYGPVQIRVTSSNGQITNVDVLQAPWGNPQDQQINGYALPILVQETLKAQTASIDMVSGATYTSNGYVMSLQSALDQLHA